MRNKFLKILYLYCLALCFTFCNKHSDDCLDAEYIYGEWEGKVTFTRLENDNELQKSTNDAKLLFNIDQTGTLHQFIKFPPPFISENYSDTISTDFSFTHLIEAGIIDLLISSEIEQSETQGDYSQVYDVLHYSVDSLSTYYYIQALDTLGNTSTLIYEWQMRRK